MEQSCRKLIGCKINLAMNFAQPSIYGFVNNKLANLQQSTKLSIDRAPLNELTESFWCPAFATAPLSLLREICYIIDYHLSYIIPSFSLSFLSVHASSFIYFAVYCFCCSFHISSFHIITFHLITFHIISRLYSDYGVPFFAQFLFNFSYFFPFHHF